MKSSFLLASLLIVAGSAVAQTPVMVENFRSMGCVNCIEPDKTFETFAASHSQLNLVYLHNNISMPSGENDPFYIPCKSDVDARMGKSFYDIIGDPDVFVSGFDAGAGAQNESEWEKLSLDPSSSQY